MLNQRRTWMLAGVIATLPLIFGQQSWSQAKEKKKAETTTSAKKDDKADKAKLAKAKKLGSEAAKLLKEGKHAEALPKLLEANELSPAPVNLFHIALSYDKTSKPKEAYDYYLKYIATGDQAKSQEAQDAIEKLEDYNPSRIEIRSDPPGAEVFMDGEKTPSGKTPLKKTLKPGKHEITLKMQGYEALEETTQVSLGQDKIIASSFVKSAGGGAAIGEKEKPAKKKKGSRVKVPITLSFGAGMSVSTTDLIGSYAALSLQLFYRIKDFGVGLGFDDLVLGDSNLFMAFPVGTYTLKVRRDLSFNFALGFGALYMTAFKIGQQVTKGGHWDLVIHVDAKLRYKVGPVMIQVVPLCTDIFPGAGSVKPAPLAQFIFLAGIAYDF